MSVAGIFSSMGSNASAILSQVQNQHTPLQQLGKDLTSGNLSGAQSDFATLQSAFSQSTSASSTANPVVQAFQQLSTDLKSGNLPGAQTDYTTLQQDLQNQSHLHNHHKIKTTEGTDQSPWLQNQNLNQLSQALSASNLTAAQQAYASLQQSPGIPAGMSGSNVAAMSLASLPVPDAAVSVMA